MNLLQDDRFNHTCEVEAGLMESESSEMLKSFFQELRKRNKLNRS